jgi:hypothetical protein
MESSASKYPSFMMTMFSTSFTLLCATKVDGVNIHQYNAGVAGQLIAKVVSAEDARRASAFSSDKIH